MSKVTETAAALAAPLAEAQGCTVWDVEYVKEAGTWYLRVFLDKEGGLSLDDCEAVSRPLSDQLDEADPTEGSYILEVGSPGLNRVLKKKEHFDASIGKQVEVHLYRPVEGKKQYVGTLNGYEDGDILLENGFRLAKKDVAQVRLYVDF
ncbi:MAG: ribosome maturation factor RimP [Oscillospiraceae bacterium]|nr:ribosome maturation factor RimP [Oscillospiraceae bacterium]